MVCTADKEKLKKIGQWNRFVALREKYKADGHHNPKEAADEALDVCMGSIEDQVKGGDLPDGGFGMDRVDVKVFDGKICDIPTSIEWVAKHIALKNIRPEDAPSAEAWGLLNSAQADKASVQDFWKTLYSKLIPSKAAIDASNALKDDGRKQLNMIDDMIKISDTLMETIDD